MSFIDLVSRAAIRKLTYSPYHYVPTEWICILFIVLFGLSTLLHVAQMIRYRIWWLAITVIVAGILEVIGWSARLWSSFNSFLTEPYQIQITCTILAPTPLVAANFIMLGIVISRLGTAYSRLGPRMYSAVFLTFDFISLIVQAIGGGAASAAAGQGKNPAVGGHIMLGGIAFQMATISVYVICAAEFILRYLHDSPIASRISSGRQMKRVPMDTNMKIMVSALAFSSLCLFIRAVYRTIELADGWYGRIISTQRYFNILDGAMIVLAIYTINFFHPGRLLVRHSDDDSSSSELKARV